MSDCPIPLADLRHFGGLFSDLADWIEALPRAPVQQVLRPGERVGASGYRRGSALDRAQAALGPPSTPFPAIPDLVDEQKWVQIAPEGLTRLPVLHHTGLEGSPEVPDFVQALAQNLIFLDHTTALNLIEAAFQSGYWARLNCKTHTQYIGPRLLSEPPVEYVVLRAPGVGRPVRLRRSSDLDFICPAHSVDCVAVGFSTVQEVEAFCLGAQNLTFAEIELECYALPLEKRAGGLLLAVPSEVFSDRLLRDGETADDEAMVDADLPIWGYSVLQPAALPDLTVLCPLARSWLEGREDTRSGFYTAQYPIGDLPSSRSPVKTRKSCTKSSHEEGCCSEACENILAGRTVGSFVHPGVLLDAAAGALGEKWSGERPLGSASKLPAVSAGLETLGIPPVAKTHGLIGPPPKARGPAIAAARSVLGAREEPLDPLQPQPQEAEDLGGSGIALALSRQSTAITQLVAHLAGQGGDVLGELTQTGLPMNSTKGVQRREKMQHDLATGQSQYYLQFLQQLHRRLHPARPVLSNESELAQVSVLEYLERQGGYKPNRDMGLIVWTLGHAIDSMTSGDAVKAREILVLLMAAIEQANIDKDWSLAYLLTLMEEPPAQLFQDRPGSLLATSTSGAPAMDCSSVGVTLKDLEVLSSKKQESTKRTATPKAEASAPSGEAQDASPKRKARFPKKPKAKASGEA
eukprot:Skav213149  [mRNA]  locus=scaffold107:614880:617192:- [translate_table: standard]